MTSCPSLILTYSASVVVVNWWMKSGNILSVSFLCCSSMDVIFAAVIFSIFSIFADREEVSDVNDNCFVAAFFVCLFSVMCSCSL